MDKFPPAIKPVRCGVYMVGDFFAFWSGEFWGCEAGSPDSAMQVAHIKAAKQEKSWSGLTVEWYAEQSHRLMLQEIRRQIDYEMMEDVKRAQLAREQAIQHKRDYAGRIIG